MGYYFECTYCNARIPTSPWEAEKERNCSDCGEDLCERCVKHYIGVDLCTECFKEQLAEDLNDAHEMDLDKSDPEE